MNAGRALEIHDVTGVRHDDEPRARQRRRQRLRRRHGRRVVLPRDEQHRALEAAQLRRQLLDGGLRGDQLAQDVRQRVRRVLEEALAHERGVALGEARALAPHEALAGRGEALRVERLREGERMRRDAAAAARPGTKPARGPLTRCGCASAKRRATPAPIERPPTTARSAPAPVEHALEIGDETFRCIVCRRRGRAAARVPAGVVDDRPVALAQRAHLRSEVARAAAEAVREHDGRARAAHLHVQRRRCPGGAGQPAQATPRIRSRNARMPSVRIPSASSARRPAAPP